MEYDVFCFLDMSSRQRFRPTNDIFDMISENDEDPKFDECGILKPVTATKSTIVVVRELFSECLFVDPFDVF